MAGNYGHRDGSDWKTKRIDFLMTRCRKLGSAEQLLAEIKEH
jgi:hypothetical protein